MGSPTDFTTPAGSARSGSARSDAAAALAVDPASVVDANDLRDAAALDTPDEVLGSADASGGRAELPLEADPADVAEQDAAVPYDDEER